MSSVSLGFNVSNEAQGVTTSRLGAANREDVRGTLKKQSANRDIGNIENLSEGLIKDFSSTDNLTNFIKNFGSLTLNASTQMWQHVTSEEFLTNSIQGVQRLLGSLAKPLAELSGILTESFNDPQKRSQLIADLMSGNLPKVLLQSFGIIVNGGAKLLSTAVDQIGIKDLGLAISSLMAGDLNSAKKHIIKCGEKLANVTGLSDLVTGFDLLLSACLSNDDKKFKQALSSILTGSIKISCVFFLFGQAAVAVNAARSVINPVIYKSVSGQATEAFANVLSKDLYQSLRMSVSSERRVALGKQAADDVSSHVSKSLDDIISVLPDNTQISSTQWQGVVNSTKDISSKSGENATNKLFLEAAENHYKNQKLFSGQSEEMLNSFANASKQSSMSKLKSASREEFFEIIETLYPNASVAEKTKISKALRAMSKNQWRYKEEGIDIFTESYSKNLTNLLKEDEMTLSFNKTLKNNLDDIKQNYAKSGIDLPENQIDDLYRAAQEGFEEGIEKAAKGFARRVQLKKDKRKSKQHTLFSNKKSKKDHDDNANTTNETIYGGGLADKPKETTLDALIYGDTGIGRQEQTIEQVIEETRKRELLGRKGNKTTNNELSHK